ncbi:MAG: DUF1475 family protein [Phycisphaerales bacterium]|nr:DUF1475 family protein [Phycisphaerales bacterium]
MAIWWLRGGAAAGIVALLGLIAGSAAEMPLAAGLRCTVDTRWGVTTMVDLYAGLAVVGVWISWRERRLWRAVVWLLALGLLGNLATLAYVFMASLRMRSIGGLLRPVR